VSKNDLWSLALGALEKVSQKKNFVTKNIREKFFLNPQAAKIVEREPH
jgi:hypothetical protein